ncbi:MAG: ATP phosphoribosyltransferase regulatory subunit, partial [Pseudomonadota bacterium]
LRLMMQTLDKTGLKNVYLDLGHVGILKGLATQAGLDSEQETSLFEALQRKAMPEVAELLDSYRIQPEHARMLYKLGELNGENALAEAEKVLQAAAQPVQEALQYLQQMAEQISIWLPEVPVHFDLAELRGYHFHTGVVFAAFVPSSGKEIARGGRYDDIGKVFGRARPATGFSTDLKTLMLLGEPGAAPQKNSVFAPWGKDQALQHRIEELRTAGRCVICGLPGQQGGARELGCIEQLAFNGTEWELTPV